MIQDDEIIFKAQSIATEFSILTIENYDQKIEGIKAAITELYDKIPNEKMDLKKRVGNMKNIITESNSADSLLTQKPEIKSERQGLAEAYPSANEVTGYTLIPSPSDSSPTQQQEISPELRLRANAFSSRVALAQGQNAGNTASPATEPGTAEQASDAAKKSSSVLDALEKKAKGLYHKFDTQKEQDMKKILKDTDVLGELINIYESTPGNKISANGDKAEDKAAALAKALDDLNPDQLKTFIENVAGSEKLHGAATRVLEKQSPEDAKNFKKLATLFKEHKSAAIIISGLTLTVVGSILAAATAAGTAVIAGIGVLVAAFGCKKYLDDRKATALVKDLTIDKTDEAIKESGLDKINPFKFLDGDETKQAVTKAKLLISTLSDIAQEQSKKTKPS